MKDRIGKQRGEENEGQMGEIKDMLKTKSGRAGGVIDCLSYLYIEYVCWKNYLEYLVPQRV